MFGHVILGLLRDCRLRHGYEIMTEYRERAGSPVSIGNIYRELARLAGQGLLQTGINPPDADARRIPYHITEKGRLAFDQWLQAPSSQDDVAHWLLFVDRVPAEVRARRSSGCAARSSPAPARMRSRNAGANPRSATIRLPRCSRAA